MNTKAFAVGEKVRVRIEKVAHGGHFIARHEGAVLFVRHAIPGEEVTVLITDVTKNFLRADVVEVHIPSEDRVQPPCQYAGSCGGCDFQHISYQKQRELKSAVIAEQFSRLAKMEISVQVEECGDPLGWRVRATATADSDGKIGFYGVRSHEVVAVKDCLVMHPLVKFAELAEVKYTPGEKVLITPQEEARVGFELSENSFWQGHINAPKILTTAVKEMTSARLGDHLFDLYGGVGIFAKLFLELIGPGGRIDLIEGSKDAVRDAKKNFADYQHVHIHHGNVERLIGKFKRADIVLLDPPRDGAGKKTLEGITHLKPREIIYISCDPAALARDTNYLRDSGYNLEHIRAFDLFPMTHHIESIALYRAMR